jgi:acyl transferase domain-containing protein/phosphopantetheinyl transferase
MSSHQAQEEIAVVGMACLFPEASNLGAFWENIVHQRCSISDPPQDWVGRYACDPDARRSDRVVSVRGGFLGELAQFDPLEHGVPPASIDGSEPEHFLALRVAGEALRDAGVPDLPLNRERTDLILGRGTFVNRGLVTLHQHGLFLDQLLRILKQLHPGYTDAQLAALREQLRRKLPPLDGQTSPGMVSSITSGRIANRLDLRGKNCCLDAACASSLIAVEHAIRGLHAGTCDAAVAGGVHVSLNPLVMMMFTQLGAISSRERLQPFSAAASGTLLGEGVGMVVLKRLADAERDGNRIYCLVRSVGSSSDGKAKSVVSPRVEGQELALRRAYQAAGVAPQTVELIEAHGTGTPLGDEIELDALRRVLGEADDPYCALGTVKSNLGHLLPAAGIAGLIKTALAIYQRTLPPICGGEDPRPELTSGKSPVYLNTCTRPWVHGTPDCPRRAGVSAFGFGGVNAHAVIEEYPHNEDDDGPSWLAAWDSELCVFSGRTRQELVAQLLQVRGFLAAAPRTPLQDVAFTLSLAMNNRPCRLAVVAHSTADLLKKMDRARQRLEEGSSRIKDRGGIFYFDQPLAREGKVAFLFPGEGAQYENMLADLCIGVPLVRRCFDLVDRAFHEEGVRPLMSRVLFPPPHQAVAPGEDYRNEPLWRMDVGVQSVTTANRAMFRLLEKLRVTPDAMLGHSSGEFAALEASGAIRLDGEEGQVRYIRAGMRTVRKVAAAARRLPEACLIAASAEDRQLFHRLAAEFGERMLIAMDNCPFQIVSCGDPQTARQWMERVQAAGISCTELPFRRAYHTPWFAAACGPLREFYNGLSFAAPRILLYSCATAAPYPADPCAVRELAMHQWCEPVRFQNTILALYDAGFRVFVEVGPRGNLSSFVDDILRKRGHEAIRTNVPHHSGIFQLHQALGLLAAHQAPIDLGYLYARRNPRKLVWEEPHPPADRRPQSHLQKVAMQLPFLELDGRDLRELSALGIVQNIPPGSSETARPVPADRGLGAGPSAPADGMASSAARPGRADAFPARQPARHPAPGEARRRHGREMIEQHCQTMSRFLSLQNDMLRAMAAHRTRAAGPGAGSAARPAAEPAAPPAAAHVAALSEADRPPPLPFVGTVVREVPGQEIVIRRTVDLGEDLYLADHVLGGRVSMADRSLLPLAVMPLTMSIEMLAEAAARLLSGGVVKTIREIRAYRWMVVEEGHLGLELHARRVAERRVHVAAREAEAVTALPIIEATVEGSDSYPPPPRAGDFHLRGAQASRFTAERMYRTAMFSGPRFQAIECVQWWAEDGQIARLKRLPENDLFRSNPAPRFLVAPVILDAAGQTIAHWHGEHRASGFNLFPYLVEEVRVHAPGHAPPDSLECRLRIAPMQATGSRGPPPDGYRANLQLVAPDGGLWMEVLGWHVKQFDLPETFHGILHDSPEVKLGERWQQPLEQVFAAGADLARRSARIPAVRREWLELCRVTSFRRELLLAHGGIWLQALAHQVLSRREREQFRSFQGSDRRRVEHLLGRVAAKDAVRQLVRRVYGIQVCPGDVEIGVEEGGRPVVLAGWWCQTLPGPPRISIAHTGQMAVALAAAAEAGVDVGVDMEGLRDWNERSLESLFTAEERQSLAALAVDDPQAWPTRLWCAKEAAAKALGLGVGADPGRYRVAAIGQDAGLVLIRVESRTASDPSEPASALLPIATIVADETVLGIALHQRR